MASSDGADDNEMQEALLKRLGTFLDEQIEETEIVKSKKKKKAKTTKTTETVSVKHSEGTSNVHQSEKSKSDATEKISKTVGKIKEFTKSAKQHNLVSSSVKLTRNKDVIKAKVEHLLSERKTKPTVVSTDDEKDDDDFTNSDEEKDTKDEYFGGFEHFDGDDSDHDEMDDGSDEDLLDDVDDPDAAAPNKPSSHGNKQLDMFKQALGITDKDLEKSRRLKEQGKVNSNCDVAKQRVTTVATLKGKVRPPPTVVVFEDRKPKTDTRKTKSSGRARDLDPDGSADTDDMDKQFDLKRARFEVRKLGVSGLEGEEKEAGLVDMMVKLGAKPPKRKYMNYKELQDQRKTELKREAEKRAIDRKLGFKVVNPPKKKSRDKNDMGVVDGQIGTYRHGVQVLEKKVIQQVTQKKLGRR